MNPFTFGNPIKEPERFVGRKAEMEQIVSRLLTSDQAHAEIGINLLGGSDLEQSSSNARKSNPRTGFILLGVAVMLIIGGVLGCQSLAPMQQEPTPTITPTLVLPSVTPSPSQTPAPTATVMITPTPTLGVGSTQVSEKDGMTMVFVPAGEFTMGSNNGKADESPVHQIYLDAFWIDQTEVTNAMYAKCVDAGECGSQSEFEKELENSNYANYPVAGVNWNMAIAYCSWVERRLPTEAEWEKAARGTKAFTYPWGEGINCGNANYIECKNYGVTPIGKYESGKSPYGAYDMSGNAWEWVSSLYKPYPYDASDGREDMNSSDARVLRGGSNVHSGVNVRSAKRYWDNPVNSFGDSYGFRCARSYP